MPMEWIWVILIVVFAVLEASTVALVSVWFIGGALAALLAALLGGKLWLQVLLFFAVSAVLLLCLRPLAKKYITPRITHTNAESNIGKVAVVTEPIDNLLGRGAVKIGGTEWSARSEDDSPIEADTKVEVLRIEGVKVFVRRIGT